MNTAQRLRRIVVRALLSGAVAVTAVHSVPGTALAYPGPGQNFVCDPQCHGHWCPGELLPSSTMPITWNMNVCHDFHELQDGQMVDGARPPDAVRCAGQPYLCPSSP